MENILVLNAEPGEVRVALLENGTPVEFHLERRTERGVVGNIYRGKVVRVLPGMQAAFVDIGLSRTAFLYVDDALPQSSHPPRSDETTSEGGTGFRHPPAAAIEDVLSQGQDVVVQVRKEPIGTKGARLTRDVTLPGRHVVFMPFGAHIGVSQRIAGPAERERLRLALAEDVAAQGGGFVVRTAAEGVAASALQREAQVLRQWWEGIEKEGARGTTPRLLFEDLDLVLRTTRDLFTEDIGRAVIDDPEAFDRVRSFVQSFAPHVAQRLELYQGTTPIFDHFGIEVELERALERKVWLKSGGTIIIDQAEALTTIDVNSGRFVGKTTLEETSTRLNLEAVREIAYQLRLRNIGGIVIIDFIDMTDPQNRDKVLEAMRAALNRDKAKTTVVRFSEIGLLEMTRKRVRESLSEVLTDTCSYCKGLGVVKSEATVAFEVLRAVRRTLGRDPRPRILINLEPGVADYLYACQNERIEELEKSFNTTVIPVAREGFHRERYEIVKVTSD